MSETKTKVAFEQSYVYARVYAIETAPRTFDDGEATCYFASDIGETEWPSDAYHFDSIEDAEVAIAQLKLPPKEDRSTGEMYPRVVELTLESRVRKAQDNQEEFEDKVVA